MNLSGISPIGWIHTIACVAALVFGAMNLIASKGTPRHRWRGTAYAASMVIAMLLSLAIFRFDIPVVADKAEGPEVFGLFHWLAIAAILLTLLGYYAASRQERGFWAYTHPIAMTLSYSLLAGGLVDELFARVTALHVFAFTNVHGRLVFPSMDVQMTQFAVDLGTLILLVVFCTQVRRRRAQFRRARRPDDSRLTGTQIHPFE